MSAAAARTLLVALFAPSLAVAQERIASGAPDSVTVRRYAKPTFAKPAPVDLRHEITTECEVVIEALAD